MKAAQYNKMPLSKGNLSSGNGKAAGHLGASRAPRTGEANPSLEEENRQLKEERDLLRALVDGYPESIYVKDKTSRKILANKASVRVVGGKNEAEILGRPDSEFFPPEVAARLLEDDKKVLAGEPLIDHEERLITATGEVLWMLATKIPWRDADGNIVGIIGGGRNITKQKEMELKLTEERNLLRTLINNLPDYVYVKDAEGRFIMANVAVARQLGFSLPDEVIGKTDFDLFPHELAARYRAEEEEMIQSGKGLHNHEGPSVDASKEVKNRWVSTTKVILRNAQGKVIGFIGLGRDITERKQAEDALARERSLLRTLIDNLPDCIYAKDAAGRKILANPADLKNFHCKTEAEAIGKTDFDLFPRDIAEKFWADDKKVIQGQPVINRAEYFLDENGGKSWLLTSKLPLHDQNGEIAGLIGIGRNITEQKEAEDALRESEAKLRQFTTQLERSNRELQDFAYVASHDLQEPLRKIVVFGERLKEQSGEKLDAEARDFLERMQRAASRMQTLINDLLTFSRVTTKARPFTQVDLAEVARDVVTDLEGRIEQVQGRVEVGTLPVVEAEALQMRQLLQNLIGNALKFRRPEASPVVKVAAQIITGPVPEEGTGIAKKLCQLTVSDNGIGFEEKYLDRIFNVFQRLHTRNEYEGTGMGLAIARKIVLYHHGEITAKSKPGEGATFIATFPLIHPKEPSYPGENHE